MSLIPWEPYWASDDLFNRASRMLARWPRAGEGDGGTRFEWSPSVNISETDKEYLIRAELPAVRKEDVKVTVDENLITISGERKQREEQKNEKVHRVESFYGSFTRSFTLPEQIDQAAVRAESQDGVLTVHIPKVKTEKKTAKQIKIE